MSSQDALSVARSFLQLPPVPEIPAEQRRVLEVLEASRRPEVLKMRTIVVLRRKTKQATE